MTAPLIFDGPLERLSMQTMSWSVNHWTSMPADELDVDAPYQRGSVWDITRKQNLIRSLLRGLPIGAIIYNDVETDDGPRYRIVDGRQRIEAVIDFVDDQFAVPATWFEPADILHREAMPFWTVDAVRFSGLSVRKQRRIRNAPMPGLRCALATVQEEAELFMLVNTAGVDQSSETLTAAERFTTRRR